MMQKKTLLISCATLSAGGAERVLSILSTPFAEAYERVIYVMWLHAQVFYSIDKRVELVDMENVVGSKNIVKKMWWFRKYVKHEQPDLVLSFLYPWSMKVIASLLFTPFKIVAAERRDGSVVCGGLPIKVLRHLLYLRANGILLQTDGNRKYYGGALAQKVRVIYNPVNIPKESLGIALHTEKEDIVVTVGSFKPEKNHDLLLRSFAVFRQSHPSYKLVIYGDGPQRSAMERLAKELDIDDCIEMPGRTQDVLDKISVARMFVLSSDLEGMPNALIEAMCVGLPCISTKVSGATDLIKSGENGILVPVRSESLMVQTMNLLADNEGYANRLGHKAVDVYQHTNAESICKQWVDYINGML